MCRTRPAVSPTHSDSGLGPKRAGVCPTRAGVCLPELPLDWLAAPLMEPLPSPSAAAAFDDGAATGGGSAAATGGAVAALVMPLQDPFEGLDGFVCASTPAAAASGAVGAAAAAAIAGAIAAAGARQITGKSATEKQRRSRITERLEALKAAIPAEVLVRQQGRAGFSNRTQIATLLEAAVGFIEGMHEYKRELQRQLGAS
ncbi:unnamed protein product [Closterium sp. NIES-65]|nr:unnamed protein product [Closterium sp. NIES-65]